MEKQIKAVIYTRFSPRRNAETCESCETQKAYCEQHAYKKKYEIVAYFADKAISGKEGDRPILWEAIEALDRGYVLLVYKLDRLARNVYLMECLRRAVSVSGARIEAVEGDVEGDGPEQVMVRQVLASVAEYERKICALRTKYAMLHHQKNGRRMGRFAPYGWTIDTADPTRMIVNEVEAKAVKIILDMHKSGVRQYFITDMLNQTMPQACRTGKWLQKAVMKIIQRGGN